MRMRAIAVGTVIGVLIGGLIVALLGTRHLWRVPAAPLQEDGGQITRVVMQYQPEAGPLVAPIYRQFLTALGKDAEVVWVVGQADDLADLHTRLGTAWPVKHREVVVGKSITTWAKDRFVAMRALDGRELAVSCAPVRTRSPNPLRRNDQEVPYHLARTFAKLFGVRGATVDFDGGDFLATADHLFAGPGIYAKNATQSPSAITQHLADILSHPVTWLGDPGTTPPHHLGMFLTVIGHTAAVGDVRQAEALAATHPDIRHALQAADGPATPAFRADLQTRLDHVARQLRSLGYTVVRVPLFPSATPRAWMSYNNGIVDTRNGKTIFYMPTFGSPTLDTAAASSFKAQLHCEVIPIDCAAIWPLGGSLHCLVNVVGRTEEK